MVPLLLAKNPMNRMTSVASRVRKTPNMAAFTIVLHSSMYVLKMAKARRNPPQSMSPPPRRPRRPHGPRPGGDTRDQQDPQAEPDPEAAVGGERRSTEHVPVTELPHTGKQLAQAAVGEGVAQPGIARGARHPAGVGRRQQERGEGEGPKAERRWVCRWGHHDRPLFLSDGQVFPPVEGASAQSRADLHGGKADAGTEVRPRGVCNLIVERSAANETFLRLHLWLAEPREDLP